MAGWLHRPVRPGSARGVSFIELLVAVAVLGVLATAVIPLARWDDKRRREVRLRVTLRQVRDAIDQYHKWVLEGRIPQKDLDQMGYPLTLDELVDGVESVQPGNPEIQIVKFLQRMPVDPMTEDSSWGMRSYQDDFDATRWGGENVYDIYSLSDRRALDDSYYVDW